MTRLFKWLRWLVGLETSELCYDVETMCLRVMTPPVSTMLRGFFWFWAHNPKSPGRHCYQDFLFGLSVSTDLH